MLSSSAFVLGWLGFGCVLLAAAAWEGVQEVVALVLDCRSGLVVMTVVLRNLIAGEPSGGVLHTALGFIYAVVRPVVSPWFELRSSAAAGRALAVRWES